MNVPPRPPDSVVPTSCPRCGAALPAYVRFCVVCGAPLAAAAAPAVQPPAPSVPPAAAACPRCGAVLKANARFCDACGAQVGAEGGTLGAAAHQAVVPGPGRVVVSARPSQGEWSPPPPPFPGAQGGGPPHQPGAAPSAPVGLPPEEPWAFQEQTTQFAARLVGMLRDSGLGAQAGLGPMLERMIRAALLDKSIYREVAVDGALQNEAWKVLGLAILGGSAGIFLLSGSLFSTAGLSGLATSAAIQFVAWLAKVWVVQLAASVWLKQQTTFSQLFRPLAYGHSPALLQFIPMVGQLIGLWTLVINTAAIRDVAGFDTTKAAILSVVGVVGSIFAVALVTPLLLPLLRF